MKTNDDGLTLFAVKTHAGMCGTDAIEAVWAKDEDDALEQMLDWAREHFWNFNTVEDLEDMDPELDLWAEPWDDEVHPFEWPGGAKFAKDFE